MVGLNTFFRMLSIAILTMQMQTVYAQLLKPIFKEGEFSGTIYQSNTDREGYTWISTDNGVYRWDTENYEHFTIADGLPSNEVFSVYQDAKMRVWMMFYNGDICYYYKGQIFNKHNSSILKKMPKINLNTGMIESNNTIYFALQNAKKLDGFKTTDIVVKENDTIKVIHRISSVQMQKINSSPTIYYGNKLSAYKTKNVVEFTTKNSDTLVIPYRIGNMDFVVDNQYNSRYVHVIDSQYKIARTMRPQYGGQVIGLVKGKYVFLKDSIIYHMEDKKSRLINNISDG